MFTEMDKMPDDSRIWIYQADRPVTRGEEIQIMTLAREFVESWTAHNNELMASFEIREKIFFIFYVNEIHASASGCSIDKSVHFIQKIENDFAISLTNRQIIAIRENEKIKLITRKGFEELWIERKINDNTIVFNNLIQSKVELNTKWEIPLSESWHSAIRVV